MSEKQSTFKPGDSFSQPIISHYLPEIFSGFNDSYEVRGYSLAFQKLSIKCGTRELFINLKATESQEIYYPF